MSAPPVSPAAAGNDVPAALRALPAVLCVVLVALLADDRFAAFQFPLDDAWIHRVYARALATGDGFAFNPGVQEAGASSPLWVILTAPAHWLEPALGTQATVVAVKLVGTLLAVSCVVSVQVLAGRLHGSARAGVAAGVLFALTPDLAFSALSGMEPVFLAAAWLAAAVALLAGRTLAVLVLLGVAPTIRPEALLFLPFGLLAAAHAWQRTGERPALSGLLALAGPSLLWMAFCEHATGHPLPTPFYVKAHPFHLDADGVQRALQALGGHGVLAAPFLWLLTAASLPLWARRSLGPWLLVVALPVVFALGVVGSRDFLLVGYYWTRWTDPAALVLEAAAVVTLAGMLQGSAPRGSWLRSRAPLLLTGAVLALSLPSWWSGLQDRRHHISADARAVSLVNVRMGLWLHDNVPPGAVGGVNDAGAIRYFSERSVLDLMGLNSASVAFETDGGGSRRGPEWLAVFPPWFGDMAPVLMREYTAVQEFHVPAEEYTPCPCPGQTQIVAFRRPVRPALIAGPPASGAPVPSGAE